MSFNYNDIYRTCKRMSSTCTENCINIIPTSD